MDGLLDLPAHLAGVREWYVSVQPALDLHQQGAAHPTAPHGGHLDARDALAASVAAARVVGVDAVHQPVDRLADDLPDAMADEQRDREPGDLGRPRGSRRRPTTRPRSAPTGDSMSGQECLASASRGAKLILRPTRPLVGVGSTSLRQLSTPATTALAQMTAPERRVLTVLDTTHGGNPPSLPRSRTFSSAPWRLGRPDR